MELYSIKFTFVGTFLQNFIRAFISSSLSFMPFQMQYSKVMIEPVLEYQYCRASMMSVSGKLEEKIGILKLEAGEEFFAKLVIEGKK